MNPHTVYTVLIVVFILIFLATAVLTICALPGWIKINNNYLKILFSSLILEVIASVFIVFNIVKPSNHKCEEGLSYKDKSWVVLNDKGQIFQLSINDSVKLCMDVDEFSDKVSNSEIYNLSKKDGSYLVMNRDAKCIGKVKVQSIKDSLKLFDEINLKKNTFNRITYYKDENNKWNLRDGESLNNKWSLKIELKGAVYTVSDSNTDYYEESGGFDKNNRQLHSFKGSDGAFYIVRISDADNYTANIQHYVTFIIIRTEIESKLK